MPIVVQKFGGSSVANVDKLKKVAQKVVHTYRQGTQVVVVVSAMGNTTNELIQLAQKVHPQSSRRELDMLLSVGERISMSLLSMAIQAQGVPAISLTGSQSGILTNDAHSHAKIIDVRPFRIQDELDKGQVVIVAGYQGTSYKREITTLGRGGSDITAIALTAALGATHCEIYSDVDGIFDADPQIVWNAQRLESISHDEMLEMARFGAKVMNADAIAYAKKHQIALYARASHLPNSRGTWIRPDGWPHELLKAHSPKPTALASFPQLLIFEAKASLPFSDCFHSNDGQWIFSFSSQHAHFVALDAHLIPGLKQELWDKCQQLQWSVREDWTNLTLVGLEIGLSMSWFKKFLDFFTRMNVQPLAVWSHLHGLTAIIPANMRTALIQVAHREFLSPSS